MRTVLRRRLAIVLAGVIAAVLGMTVAASGSSSDSCDAHQGLTLFEDASGRVFEIGGHVMACARPNGPAHSLTRPGSALTPGAVSDVTLAGRFVAWKRFTVDESLERSERALMLLDIKSGEFRTIAAAIGPSNGRSNVSLADFVLNATGTLVWVVNSTSCGNPCTVTSKLSQSRLGHPNTVVERDTNPGPADGPAPNAPIAAVGLSRSGDVAYWIAKGDVRSHHIP